MIEILFPYNTQWGKLLFSQQRYMAKYTIDKTFENVLSFHRDKLCRSWHHGITSSSLFSGLSVLRARLLLGGLHIWLLLVWISSLLVTECPLNLSVCVTAVIHCCSLHELKSCFLGALCRMTWCTVQNDSTNSIDYVFHSVTTYVAYGIHTTFSLNLMPLPFILTSSSHFKMDLISFWHSHSLLISLSISGKYRRIWISHVAVGKTDFWCFSTFSLPSKKL